MNNQTFGIVVGVIIALALAMFGGLYMLGLTSEGGSAFNDGYEYQYDDSSYYPNDDFVDGEFPQPYDDFIDGEFADFEQLPADDYYYDEGAAEFYDDPSLYFDENGDPYDLTEYDYLEYEPLPGEEILE